VFNLPRNRSGLILVHGFVFVNEFGVITEVVNPKWVPTCLHPSEKKYQTTKALTNLFMVFHRCRDGAYHRR